MKLNKLALAAVMMTSAMSSMAFARGSSSGVMTTLNVFMKQEDRETTSTGGSTSSTKVAENVYDIKIGYLGGNGLYLGGIYTMKSEKQGDDTVDGKNLGASLGYVGASGFFIKGHYILSAEFGDLKEGTGIQADLGYISNVTGNFLVGVELTYRSIDYKKDETNPGMNKYKSTEIFPMLTVGFVF